MQVRLPKGKVADAEQFIRRAGYGRLVDRRAGQVSFVKRLHGDLYPRFHAYIKDAGADWIFNMHLDQRATVYKGVTAHAGEYDGPVLEKEAARVVGLASLSR